MAALSPPVLAEIVCPICGGTECVKASGAEWNGTYLPFSFCCGCGLKYMNPRPTEAWYEDYYRTTFWVEHTGSQDPTMIDRKHRKEKRRARMLRAMIVPRVKLAAGDRILDVGTGWGFAPKLLMDETGCSAAGIEPSDYTARYFTATLGIERIARSIYDPELVANHAGTFKLVMFSTALENTYDPLRTLRIVRELLCDDGMLFVHTPNVYFEELGRDFPSADFFAGGSAAAVGAGGL